MPRSTFVRLAVCILFVRLVVLLGPWVAYPWLGGDAERPSLLEYMSTRWNRWDAPHYVYIAENGYVSEGDEGNFIVFMPAYPVLIRCASWMIPNAALAGIFLSVLFSVAGGIVFYRLVQMNHSESVARWSVICLSLFPTSYFLNAPYTESLFFLVVCGSLYFALNERWLGAGACAGLAALCRPFGLFVCGAAALDWIRTTGKKPNHLLWLMGPTVLAFGAYLWINYQVYGDPLAYQEIVGRHWHKQLASPIEGIISRWRHSAVSPPGYNTFMVGRVEAVTAALALLLIPVMFAATRTSWAAYYCLCVVLFTSTSFILSGPRYLLSIPPFFVLIGLAARLRLFRYLWILASTLLLVELSQRYTGGWWAF